MRGRDMLELAPVPSLLSLLVRSWAVLGGFLMLNTNLLDFA
jgi:hypothetical protein